jgi:hypothetical protein
MKTTFLFFQSVWNIHSDHEWNRGYSESKVSDVQYSST